MEKCQIGAKLFEQPEARYAIDRLPVRVQDHDDRVGNALRQRRELGRGIRGQFGEELTLAFELLVLASGDDLVRDFAVERRCFSRRAVMACPRRGVAQCPRKDGACDFPACFPVRRITLRSLPARPEFAVQIGAELRK